MLSFGQVHKSLQVIKFEKSMAEYSKLRLLMKIIDIMEFLTWGNPKVCELRAFYGLVDALFAFPSDWYLSFP